ncbi:SMP-30/gluconolactonase/LRE family protein [Croceitalea rosinachiae]|uniref:SMP-30/gluconolactonase/LRE family protein n=1 Tax=Croceitalea rosinachiae TaxID=3075596 RepID=A0ABU3AFG5_9FLAO|nr:SMP-30/gluconolactonase/LRE family protein [Croceitalea sp. F388]MDT0607843.1 SMP-30/gluconolactonase/LRE family protein [Croceitalea sp. F388]
MQAQLVFYADNELLEGPIFDYGNSLLYFVSIFDGLVYCYEPSTKKILSVKLDSPVSNIYIKDKKNVLAASKNGFYEINFNTLQAKFTFQIEIDDNARFNDGIEDAVGRLLIGTMGYPEIIPNLGKVFSFYKGQYKIIIENTDISNGLAFSKDNSLLYFIDTPSKKVAKYSYDMNSGDVKFEDYIIEFKENGSPDGMCRDGDGNLWIAEWGGACLSLWNPSSGKKLKVLDLPCPNVTSCTFDDKGGLYVTTAKSDNQDNNFGGGLFYFENSNF